MSSLVSKLTGGNWSPSARQFAFFRIVFGSYLFIHFADLVPYAAELFGPNGTMPQPSLQPAWKTFPNALALLTSDLGAAIFVSALALFSLLFAFGVWRRPIALLLWYGWACLFHRNLFIANPGLPMVGWLLLACALIPSGERLLQGRTPESRGFVSPVIYYGAFFILALGYTVSGVHKMGSISWWDGSAIGRLLDNPLARDNAMRALLRSMPPFVPVAMTYGSLALEVLFLPLALFQTTRKWVWLAMIGMHAGILTIIDFADLTAGVLMMHLFTFDPRWLGARKLANEGGPVLYFDGVCGLCNRFVDFVFREGGASRFYFAMLQGEYAAKTLSPDLAGTELTTVVVRDGSETLTRSDAALRVLDHLGGTWRLALVFKLVPRPFRDAVYASVSRNRYRWFGKKETCRLPSKEERARFHL